MKRLIPEEQSLEEQRRAHPHIEPTITHEISMVIPGRRALGESWVRVTIGHDQDNMTFKTEAAAAPADNKPIMAVTGRDAEIADYILTAQMEKARERAVAPQELTPQERYDLVNEAWHNYVEEKKKYLSGTSTFGSGVRAQRDRVYQNPATRPLMFKE